MKVNRITPVPIPDSVRIEVTREEALTLEYFFGRLSLNKVEAVTERVRAGEVHDLTSALYFTLFDLSHEE